MKLVISFALFNYHLLLINIAHDLNRYDFIVKYKNGYIT